MTTPQADPAGTIHACPPGNSALTPCCQQTTLQLGRDDQLTYGLAEITCRTHNRVYRELGY